MKRHDWEKYLVIGGMIAAMFAILASLGAAYAAPPVLAQAATPVATQMVTAVVPQTGGYSSGPVFSGWTILVIFGVIVIVLLIALLARANATPPPPAPPPEV